MLITVSCVKQLCILVERLCVYTVRPLHIKREMIRDVRFKFASIGVRAYLCTTESTKRENYLFD